MDNGIKNLKQMMTFVLSVLFCATISALKAEIKVDGVVTRQPSLADIETIRSQTAVNNRDSLAQVLASECSTEKRWRNSDESYFSCKRRIKSELSAEGEMVWRGNKYVYERQAVASTGSIIFPEHPSSRTDWVKLSEEEKIGLRDDYRELKLIAERKLADEQRKYRVEKRYAGESKHGFHKQRSEWGKPTILEKTNSVVGLVQTVFTGAGTGVLTVVEWLTEGDYVERVHSTIQHGKEWLREREFPSIYRHADFIEDHAEDSTPWVAEEGFAVFFDLVFEDPNAAIEYYGHKSSGMPHVSTLKSLLEKGDIVLVTKRGVCIGASNHYPVVLDIDRRIIKRLRYVYNWESAFDDSVELLSPLDCFA